MNTKHFPRIADFGLSDSYVPFGARGLKTKQTLPPPSPPAPSDELLAAQKEQEEREAKLALQEEQRKRAKEGDAQAAFAGAEAERLQGQFRSTGGRAKAGRSGTGLRL